MATAQTKISGMNAGVAATGDELFETVQNSLTKRLSHNQIVHASPVADVDAARALNSVTPPQRIFVGTEDGGYFKYDATDTTSDDNGGDFCGTIIVDAKGRRWKSTALDVLPEMFGAGQETDSATAINAAIAYANSLGVFKESDPGGVGQNAPGVWGSPTVRFSPVEYDIQSPVTIYGGVNYFWDSTVIKATAAVDYVTGHDSEGGQFNYARSHEFISSGRLYIDGNGLARYGLNFNGASHNFRFDAIISAVNCTARPFANDAVSVAADMDVGAGTFTINEDTNPLVAGDSIRFYNSTDDYYYFGAYIVQSIDGKTVTIGSPADDSDGQTYQAVPSGAYVHALAAGVRMLGNQTDLKSVISCQNDVGILIAHSSTGANYADDFRIDRPLAFNNNSGLIVTRMARLEVNYGIIGHSRYGDVIITNCKDVRVIDNYHEQAAMAADTYAGVENIIPKSIEQNPFVFMAGVGNEYTCRYTTYHPWKRAGVCMDPYARWTFIGNSSSQLENPFHDGDYSLVMRYPLAAFPNTGGRMYYTNIGGPITSDNAIVDSDYSLIVDNVIVEEQNINSQLDSSSARNFLSGEVWKFYDADASQVGSYTVANGLNLSKMSVGDGTAGGLTLKANAIVNCLSNAGITFNAGASGLSFGNGFTQLTVGAAGTAAALPSKPTAYLNVGNVNGTRFVLAIYAVE